MKWVTHGFLPSYASPVMDRERLYTVDNSAILGAFDLKSGKEVWTKRLGIAAKASPVLADGKLYVGTEGGKFYILRPTATGAETLDEDLIGTATNPEPIVASPAVAGGRIYVTTMSPGEPVAGSAGHLYAIGPKARTRAATTPAPAAAPVQPSTAPVAQVQVFPYEALLDTGGEAGVHAEAVRRQGQLHPHRAGERSAVDARSARRSRRRRRRLRGAGHRIGRLRQGHGWRRQRTGARARDSAAAVDARLRGH